MNELQELKFELQQYIDMRDSLYETGYTYNVWDWKSINEFNQHIVILNARIKHLEN